MSSQNTAIGVGKPRTERFGNLVGLIGPLREHDHAAVVSCRHFHRSLDDVMPDLVLLDRRFQDKPLLRCVSLNNRVRVRIAIEITAAGIDGSMSRAGRGSVARTSVTIPIAPFCGASGRCRL